MTATLRELYQFKMDDDIGKKLRKCGPCVIGKTLSTWPSWYYQCIIVEQPSPILCLCNVSLSPLSTSPQPRWLWKNSFSLTASDRKQTSSSSNYSRDRNTESRLKPEIKCQNMYIRSHQTNAAYHVVSHSHIANPDAIRQPCPWCRRLLFPIDADFPIPTLLRNAQGVERCSSPKMHTVCTQCRCIMVQDRALRTRCSCGLGHEKLPVFFFVPPPKSFIAFFHPPLSLRCDFAACSEASALA